MARCLSGISSGSTPNRCSGKRQDDRLRVNPVLLREEWETMATNDGVALAAPQIASA